VGSDAIVRLPPLLDQHLYFLQCVEDLPVQELIPELAIEALDIAVLPRTSGFYVQRPRSHSPEPLPDCFRRELGAVVRPDVLRHSPLYHELAQTIQDVIRPDVSSRPYCQALSGVLVDHRQHPYWFSIVGPSQHEVVGPHVVLPRGSES